LMMLRVAVVPGNPGRQVKKIVEATLHTTPKAATHWSVRTDAQVHGQSCHGPKYLGCEWTAHIAAGLQAVER